MHRLVIASVTLIGLVGLAVIAGYLFLFAGGGDRAASLAPAHSAVYVNVYLQPSTGQQMNLSSLIGRLPGFADEAALDTKVDQIVQNLLSPTGMDYREQVKPWLGDQLAIAAWPTGTDASESEVVVIAQVRDVDAAEASLAELASEGGSVESRAYGGVDLHVGATTTYALLDGMLVAGPTPEAIEDVVDADGDAESLADQADFRAAMDRVSTDHLASVFVDLAGIEEASGTENELGGWTTASAVLVAEQDGLRLSGSAPLPADAEPDASAAADVADRVATLTEWMPEGTLAEIVAFDLRALLEDAEAAATGLPEGEELGSALDTLRAVAAFGLGINLDTDVLPLLEGEVALAVGALEDGMPSSAQLFLRPPDAASAAETLATLSGRLESIGGSVETESVEGLEITTLMVPDLGSASYAVTGDVIVIGLSVDDVRAAIEANASGATLAASDAYERSFAAAGAHGGTEIYVDVASLSGAAGELLALPDDARDILSGIGTFALTLPSRDDQIEFHAVLTVDEP
jgi:hypothetical protein